MGKTREESISSFFGGGSALDPKLREQHLQLVACHLSSIHKNALPQAEEAE